MSGKPCFSMLSVSRLILLHTEHFLIVELSQHDSCAILNGASGSLISLTFNES